MIAIPALSLYIHHRYLWLLCLQMLWGTSQYKDIFLRHKDAHHFYNVTPYIGKMAYLPWNSACVSLWVRSSANTKLRFFLICNYDWVSPTNIKFHVIWMHFEGWNAYNCIYSPMNTFIGEHKMGFIPRGTMKWASLIPIAETGWHVYKWSGMYTELQQKQAFLETENLCHAAFISGKTKPH